MKVLMGVGYYEGGGFSTVLNMLSKYLKRLNVEVTVATRIIRMNLPQYVNLIKRTPEEFVRESKKYDIIHVHTSYPYTRALVRHGLTGNLVFTWHGYAQLKYVPGLINKVIGFYIKHIGYKTLITKVKFITAVSEYARQQLKKLYAVDAVVIPNGVELNLFNRCDTRDLEERYSGYKPIVFNATAYNKLKGGDLLIKYFKAIKRRFPKAYLIARGVQKYTMKLSDDLRRNIESLGIMPYE